MSDHSRSEDHKYIAHQFPGDLYNEEDEDLSAEYVDVGDEARNPTPTYQFRGTWGAAAQDASKAMIEIGSASKTFGKAVAKSGIADAGWSIGGALAKTANRGALLAADYAIKRSGANQNNLPGPLRNWLHGKERRDAAKRRAEEVKRKCAEDKLKGEWIAIEKESMPGRSLSSSRSSVPSDSTNESLYSEPGVIGRRPNFGRRHSSIASKAPTPALDEFDDFCILETSDEEEESPAPGTWESHKLVGSPRRPDPPVGDSSKVEGSTPYDNHMGEKPGEEGEESEEIGIAGMYDVE